MNLWIVTLLTYSCFSIAKLASANYYAATGRQALFHFNPLSKLSILLCSITIYSANNRPIARFLSVEVGCLRTMATIGVRSKFIIRDAAVHCFESESKQLDAAQTAPSPIGGNNEDTKYNHQYTGKHDHGLLPELKSGGPHGQLIQALLVSKVYPNYYSTLPTCLAGILTACCSIYPPVDLSVEEKERYQDPV